MTNKQSMNEEHVFNAVAQILKEFRSEFTTKLENSGSSEFANSMLLDVLKANLLALRVRASDTMNKRAKFLNKTAATPKLLSKAIGGND